MKRYKVGLNHNELTCLQCHWCENIGLMPLKLWNAARGENISFYLHEIPYSPAFSCLQLFGEVYQWAIIPRGIIASAANFTFYQKKLIDPNPAQFTL